MKKFNFLLIAFCIFAFSSCENWMVDDSRNQMNTIGGSNVTIIYLDDGTRLVVPDGAIVTNNGYIIIPGGSTGSAQLGDGSIIELPPGTTIDRNGNITRPSGTIQGTQPILTFTHGLRYEMYFFSLPEDMWAQTVSLTAESDFEVEEDGARYRGTFSGTLHAVPLGFFMGDFATTSASFVVEYCRVTLISAFILHNPSQCPSCGEVFGRNRHERNSEVFNFDIFPLPAMPEPDLPTLRIPRNFVDGAVLSSSFSLPKTSDFSSDHTRHTVKTFTFPLLPGGMPAGLPNLLFTHTISANFEAVSRGFYQYRTVLIGPPPGMPFSDARFSPGIVESISFTYITFPHRPEFPMFVRFIDTNAPFTGEVVSFNVGGTWMSIRID